MERVPRPSEVESVSHKALPAKATACAVLDTPGMRVQHAGGQRGGSCQLPASWNGKTNPIKPPQS